jgi:hypothetical protein
VHLLLPLLQVKMDSLILTKPHIEEMHPNLSPEQQEEMFNACHGENGMMQNHSKFRDRMNNF